MIKRLLFLDGKFLPTTKAFLESLSPGILTGRGIFETMRVYQGEIFLLEDHFKRLFHGIKKLHIKIPCSKKKLEQYLYLVLAQNKLKEARLRLTVWHIRKKVRISVMAWPYRSASLRQYTLGYKADMTFIQRCLRGKDPSIKSIDYLPFLVAYRQAKAKGYDEVLLLDKKGFLVEGSRTNIFCVKNGIIFTPSLKSGCLKGITRKTVIDIHRKKGIKIRQISLRSDKLFCADEAFLTNSLIEIMPLTQLQGKKIGRGRIGPVTLQLLKSYRQRVKQTTDFAPVSSSKFPPFGQKK